MISEDNRKKESPAKMTEQYEYMFVVGYLDSLPVWSFSITWSREKLAAYCLGGVLHKGSKEATHIGLGRYKQVGLDMGLAYSGN